MPPLAAGAAALGVVVALVAPHALLLFGGVLLALWGAVLLARAAGASVARPRIMAPVVAALLLVLAGWTMRFLAGPVGLALAALPDGPFSPAAQAYLVPPLAAAAWIAAGLWPAHRASANSLLTLAGVALLGRVVAPGFADGLEHWRSLFALLLVAGLWRAALTRRMAEALASLALFGGVVAGPAGIAVGAWLLGAAATVAAIVDLQPASSGRPVPLRWLAVALALAGLPSLFLAGLRTEIVYTGLAGLAVLAGLGAALRHRRRTPTAEGSGLA